MKKARTTAQRSAAAKKAWKNRRLKHAGFRGHPSQPVLKAADYPKLRALVTDDMLEARDVTGKGASFALSRAKPHAKPQIKPNGHFDLVTREAMSKLLLAMQRHSDGENSNARGMVHGAIEALVASLGYLEG